MSEEEKKKEMVEEFKLSGKSQREFCRENGIKRSTLRYWMERTEEIKTGNEITFAYLIVGDTKC